MISFLNLLPVIGITIYIAILYINPVMMLLVYMEAAIFVVAAVSLLIRRFRCRVQLEVPVGIAERGRESLVKLNITNRGLFAINRMKALLVVKDSMRGKRKKYWMTLPVVPKGESEYIQMVSFFGTGNYDIILKKMRVYDISGLFHWDIRIKKQSVVQVMPELHDVPVRMTLATKNFYGEADVYDENTPGHDNSELFQVREYRAGDRLQNVHWKLTAKQDDLIVKEHSLPKACPVILFLSYQPGKRSQLLVFLEAVASLSFSIMDAGCPHYVVWYDGTEMDVMRVRVDDEESLFYFIGVLMKVKWIRCKEDLMQRYRDKYRQEPYVWALTLDEKLQLFKEKELLTRYSTKKLKASLGQMELLL
ncbi:MAG: DUF58 domain-containing protein [Lachnospiraceae bacterium]